MDDFVHLSHEGGENVEISDSDGIIIGVEEDSVGIEVSFPPLVSVGCRVSLIICLIDSQRSLKNFFVLDMVVLL